jgi:hypothetical protein
MAHNVYVTIVLSTDGDDFPNEYGVLSQVRKQIKEIVAKDDCWKMKRYKFDIVHDSIDFEEFEEMDMG